MFRSTLSSPKWVIVLINSSSLPRCLQYWSPSKVQVEIRKEWHSGSGAAWQTKGTPSRDPADNVSRLQVSLKRYPAHVTPWWTSAWDVLPWLENGAGVPAKGEGCQTWKVGEHLPQHESPRIGGLGTKCLSPRTLRDGRSEVALRALARCHPTASADPRLLAAFRTLPVSPEVIILASLEQYSCAPGLAVTLNLCSCNASGLSTSWSSWAELHHLPRLLVLLRLEGMKSMGRCFLFWLFQVLSVKVSPKSPRPSEKARQPERDNTRKASITGLREEKKKVKGVQLDTAQSHASSAGPQPRYCTLAAARAELLETFSSPRAGKGFPKAGFCPLHWGEDGDGRWRLVIQAWAWAAGGINVI